MSENDLLLPEQASIYAANLIYSVVPFKKGDAKYAEVCQDFGNKGTTCGFLPHWMLWALGYRGPLLNRSDKAEGLRYVNGANISKIWNIARAPFKPFKLGTEPELGDIGYISNGPPETEHVFVFLEVVRRNGKVFWRTADAGQEGNGAAYKERELVGRMLGGRQLQGWIPLKALTYTKPPREIDVDLMPPCEFGLCGPDDEQDALHPAHANPAAALVLLVRHRQLPPTAVDPGKRAARLREDVECDAHRLPRDQQG